MDFDITCDCSGKVNINDWQLDRDGLFSHKEVDNVLFPQADYPFSCIEVRLFDCVMPGAVGVMNLNHLTNCMEMQLKILNRQSRSTVLSRVCDNDDENYFSLRKMICNFILYFRAYMNGIRWDLSALEIAVPEINKDVDALFNSLKRFFSTLRNIPDSILHYAASNIGNKCKQPEFHLCHTHIELRWFFITLVHSRTMWCQYQMHPVEEFENSAEMVINDLIYFALKVFERLSLNWTVDHKQKTPYFCTCTRELWLMLQIFIDSLEGRMKTKTFWDHVNSCIHKVLNTDQTQMIFWHKSGDSVLPDCKNPELFCIWIVYHLSLLYGYSNDGVYLQSNSSRIKSNYEQVEKVLKIYVCKGGKDGERDELDVELKIIISLLHELIINWWQPRVPVISFLWDCFHKRLDQPFLLQTSGPWALSLEKKTAADILKQINNRIDSKFEHSKESSYGMFLYLIGTFLKKYSKVDPKYWNQIKGRVYTKFSKNKVAEFSESGLYNFISLFITLAVTADITNVCTTMLDLLPSTQELNSEYNKKCNLIWKGKLTCLLLFNERRLSFAPIINHFTETVNLISCRKDETSRSMMTNFVDVLNTVLSASEKIDLGEYNFIGGWIDRYLLECPKNRIGFLLEMLANVLDKCVILQVSCDNSDGAREMLNALWGSVACRVRQLVFDPVLTGDNYKIISKLAVIFTLEAVRDPATAKTHKHSTMSLFQHFAASVFVKDIRITQCYLTMILENGEAVQSLKKEIANFDIILIQAWIKCSIVGYNTDREETRILQNYILNLDDIKEIFMSNFRNLQEFKNGNEPIITFIISFMERQNALKTDQERLRYNAKCKTYFKNLEKWVLIPVTEETKNTDLAIWIYRCLGTLILCLSPMLYAKNQPNDMLRTLINKVLLVPENSAQSYIKQLGKRIFSMVLLGLEKLNVKSDILLQAMIRDILDQYLPVLITEDNSGCSFKVSDSFLKFFKDAKCEYLRLIFETLMANFYTISSDNVVHKHANLITWLIKTLLKEGTYPKHVTEHIIQICSPNIFGCYMKVSDHHPHKLHTIDFIKNVIKNAYYKGDKSIREKFYTAVSAMVQKYLILNTQFTFELIQSILTIEKSIIINLIPQLDTIIFQAEQNRRPNVVSLRFMFNQLKKQMLNMNNDV
ncbi:protein MMS22-like isoform X2 [Linepithema humile]|uniref:protein MMS22-like isoform X2 n=1 Tax=Linepithema humile TaxID=83485 RepID=UPI0006235456|nr:PREDICTED: protein MMS22-like [Linepithema humile]XP_012220704.1 PREDICTED: protein MMS22-like [Linepithema humile]